MSLYLIEMFAVSLILTQIIELIVASLFRIPFGKDLLPIVLINILTNPVAVFINWLLSLYRMRQTGFMLQLPIEVLVIFVEFCIYKSFSKSGWGCKRPFLLALCSNAASWLIGLFIS